MSISDNIKELIQEAYIISEPTISVDLQKFESGECNKLIILGLSGAGKTTLGKQLAEKYNCPVIDLDDVIRKIEKKYPHDKFARSKQIYLMSQEVSKILNNKIKSIIGGLDIVNIYYDDPNINKLLLTLPFIFLGKSALKSSWDAAMRNYKLYNDEKDSFLSHIYYSVNININDYYKNIQQLKKARCSIKGSIIKQVG